MKQEVTGCGHGGDWAVRITARPAEQPDDAGIRMQRRVSVIFYMMDEAVRLLEGLALFVGHKLNSGRPGSTTATR